MIRVALKDDEGRVIQTIEYPISAMAAEQVTRRQPKEKSRATVAGLCGKVIKNLIVSNIKDKYFGGLL